MLKLIWHEISCEEHFSVNSKLKQEFLFFLCFDSLLFLFFKFSRFGPRKQYRPTFNFRPFIELKVETSECKFLKFDPTKQRNCE